MKCLDDYNEKTGLSEFPPCGRFQLAGFNFDNQHAYAIVYYTPLERRADEVSYLNTVECCSEAYNVEHLSVLHDTLPDGDERNYVAAIHDAVEGLNDFSLNSREVYNFAHYPDRADRLTEEFSHNIAKFQQDIKKALEKVSSYGDQKKYALHRDGDVGELLARQNRGVEHITTGLTTKFDM